MLCSGVLAYGVRSFSSVVSDTTNGSAAKVSLLPAGDNLRILHYSPVAPRTGLRALWGGLGGAVWPSLRPLASQSVRLHFGHTFGTLPALGTHVQPQPEQRFALICMVGIYFLLGRYSREGRVPASLLLV